MWPFRKKKPPLKNVYRMTYIPCCEIDPENDQIICRPSNMREAYVEAENMFEAQKAFADMKTSRIVFSPHLFIDRITEIVHRTG